jgi:hypothetical protein
MAISERFGIGLLVLTLTGCGGGDDGGESGAAGFAPGTTCGMSLAVSGAVDATIAQDSAIACVTQLSSGAGIDAGFLTIGGETIQHVDLVVDDVEKDATGAGFPAELEIVLADQRRWTASSCTADVLAHGFDHSDELFDHHRIAGTLTCTAPATSAAGPALTVESFAFVCTVPWTK